MKWSGVEWKGRHRKPPRKLAQESGLTTSREREVKRKSRIVIAEVGKRYVIVRPIIEKNQFAALI